MSSVPLQQPTFAGGANQWRLSQSTIAFDPSTPLSRLGVWLLAFYVFLAYSRITEILATKFGVLPLMPVVMAVVLLASLLTAGMLRVRSHPAVLMMIGYYGWMLLSVVFSIWKGGSIGIVLYQLKMALLCVAILSLVGGIPHVRQVMFAISISMLVLVAASNNVAEADVTRFQFEAGSLSNPNEIANHFLIGLPLAWIIGVGSKGVSLRNIIRLGVLMAVGIILMKTGSRGGLVVLACLALTLLFTLTFANKVKMLLLGALILFVGIGFAPRYALDRYLTMSGDQGIQEAVASKTSREQLLRASISITLRNPIFGVGPANFVVAFNDDLREAGQRHHWEATHNAFTQVSSEMGIPALLLYVGSFGICIRRLLKVRRATKGIPQLNYLFQMSSLLLLSTLAYLISGMFTSNAHQFYFPMLVGLSVMVDYWGTSDIQRFSLLRSSQAAAPPNAVGPAFGHAAARGARYV